jgi:hypothetical protein
MPREAIAAFRRSVGHARIAGRVGRLWQRLAVGLRNIENVGRAETDEVFESASAASASLRPTIGARIVMPFSPWLAARKADVWRTTSPEEITRSTA